MGLCGKSVLKNLHISTATCRKIAALSLNRAVQLCPVSWFHERLRRGVRKTVQCAVKLQGECQEASAPYGLKDPQCPHIKFGPEAPAGPSDPNSPRVCDGVTAGTASRRESSRLEWKASDTGHPVTSSNGEPKKL